MPTTFGFLGSSDGSGEWYAASIKYARQHGDDTNRLDWKE